MMPQIYDAIERAIANGVPPQYIASMLIAAGWPPPLVNEAIEAWLTSHGRSQRKTDFTIWLKKYQKKARPAIFLMVAIGVVSSGIMLLKPWPTKLMVDSVFGNVRAPGVLAEYTGTPTLILITSLLTIIIFLAGALVGTLKDYLMVRIGFWLNRGIKEESFRHILHLPLYHQERLAKGDYVYRQNVVTNSLSELVLGTTASIFESIIMIIGVLAIMLSFDVRLTLISVIVVPFIFVLIRIFGPKLSKIGQALNDVASKTASSISESVDNAETVQSFTLEEKQLAHADKLWHETYELTKRATLWGKLFRSSNSLTIILGTSAVMYFGGSAALRGEISLGQLLIFMIYMGYLLGPVENLATQIGARKQKAVDVGRVFEVLTDNEGIEFLRQDNHFPVRGGRIEFQNVSYSYNNVPVLKNVNFVVEAGQKVGIIGPSGSGKSTVLKLLPLFVQPSQGKILIDNFDIQTVSLQELRQNIAWIAQSPQLFSETIYENLLDSNVYGQVDPTHVANMLEVSNVREFLGQLPLGLESPAGEGGSSLSGGQRQRIAIARGLLKHAPIVCMDEPTAALDSKSENMIRDSIKPALEGKTVLLVTHRKALLSLMDVVYVLEQGVLRNVQELGGLEAYLRRVEGDEEKQDVQAQRFEQLLDDFTKFQAKRRTAETRQPVQASVVAQKNEQSDTIYISHDS